MWHKWSDQLCYGTSLLKMNFIFKMGDAILTFHAAEAHR